eukprot:TRINITY_DN472_c0_g1_i1.p1 TRINITY_DN472_c0_g1~~TRINITY_DN472_c0_g1_i1.p1  ORF type:complete len:396 (+),score=143.33 TRINITY_DN472_c0_g1_i1:165-1190(+)
MDKAILGGKRTIEPCEKIHSEVIREKFLQHKDSKDDSDLRKKYEDYSIRDLEFVIAEADAYGRREVERMRKEPRNKALSSEVNAKLSSMKRESTALATKAEKLEDCDGRQKAELLKQSEDLAEEAKKFEKEEEDKLAKTFNPKACEVCGTGYLGNKEQDYEQHLRYKVHESYTLVRARLQELKDKQAERERIAREKKEKKREEEKKRKDEEKAKKEEKKAKKTEEADEGKEKDGADDAKDDEKADEKSTKEEKKASDKERKGKDSKDKNKDKDKGKDKDKDRDKDRDRRKEKDSSESKDRSKGKDKDRSRRSRDRDRDRERRKKDRRASRSRSRSRSRRRR